MKHVNVSGPKTTRTAEVTSTQQPKRTAATAAGLADKLRTPSSQGKQSEAATALLTSTRMSPVQLGVAFENLGGQVAGFHEHGRVRAPNPRAIDTTKMAHNLDAILNRALPEMKQALASMERAPADLQTAARKLAVTLHDEKYAIERWLVQYGGASADIDMRDDRFGTPLKKMATFSDELKAKAADWARAGNQGGVDRFSAVVYGKKFLDDVRAKGQALDAALKASPPKKAQVEKAEAALLKALDPLFKVFQDAGAMAEIQTAIHSDFWQSGDTATNAARAVRSAIIDGVGLYGSYGMSEHTRGWVDYARNTADNLISQHMAVDFHQRGNPPAREQTWLDDPRIPDWRK